MFQIESVVIDAPRRGACRFCGMKHGRNEGHVWNSVLFLQKFYWRYKRLPTRDDAEGKHALAQRAGETGTGGDRG